MIHAAYWVVQNATGNYLGPVAPPKTDGAPLGSSKFCVKILEFVSSLRQKPVCSDEVDGLFDDLGFRPTRVASPSGSGQIFRQPVQEVVEAKPAILLPDFVLVGAGTMKKIDATLTLSGTLAKCLKLRQR